MKRERPALSKIITDDLIDIFGQNEQEILNFIGVTNEVDEYELRFTDSTEVKNLEDSKTEADESSGSEESVLDEEFKVSETDKDLALAQIQAKEAEIAADINKYLKALKTTESLEFELISREEIFERLKCKCFEWNRIKKKETIKDMIKQICKAKTCRQGVKKHEEEDVEIAKAIVEHKRKKIPIKIPRKLITRKYRICTGPINRRAIRRKRRKKRYTHIQIQQLVHMKEKYSRDTIKSQFKKFHDVSKSRGDSISSEEGIDVVPSHKQLLRAKDSVILKKGFDVVQSEISSTESSSTVSGNIQHLDSDEKIGKRKINSKMFSLYLNEFNCIKNFAFVFIDDIVQEAELKVNVSIIDPLDMKIQDYVYPEYVCGEDESPPPSLNCKSISLYSEVYGYDLTPHEGKNMVRDIIKYWNLRKTWKHCINFLGKQTDSCSDYFKYEVKWSEPTFSYPVPQVTASVYFTVELSRVRPTLFPPKVTFVFESERYKFTGYDDIAHEKFLDEIIDCKTTFFKSMRF